MVGEVQIKGDKTRRRVIGNTVLYCMEYVMKKCGIEGKIAQKSVRTVAKVDDIAVVAKDSKKSWRR